MKKFNKIMTVLVLVVAVFAFVSPAFASNIKFDASHSGASSTFGKEAVQRTWDIILTILQVAAVAALVFAGVRYMFASADQKADIKKSMGILAIGAVLVFGATFVIDFIISLAKDVGAVDGTI